MGCCTWQKSEGQLTDRLCPSHSLQEFTELVNIGNSRAGKRSLMVDNAGTGTLEPLTSSELSL